MNHKYGFQKAMELCANRSRNVFASVSFDFLTPSGSVIALKSNIAEWVPECLSQIRILLQQSFYAECYEDSSRNRQHWHKDGRQLVTLGINISAYLNIISTYLYKIETNILYSFAHRSFAHLSSLWRWSPKPLENLAARSMRRKRWKAWTHVFSMEKSLEESQFVTNRHNSSQGFF